MFYAHFVLAKKGPLARIWLAAHWDKKLTKAHVFETNIEDSVKDILKPKVKMALRTSGHLLLGVVRIYSRKAKYLLTDCNEAFVKIKMAFRPGMVDLPEDNREAAMNAITLPEVFHDFDTAMPDIAEVDIQAQFKMNQTRAEEITMREDYGNLSLDQPGVGLGVDDGFGEQIGSPEMLREPQEPDFGADGVSLAQGGDMSRAASTFDQQSLMLGQSQSMILGEQSVVGDTSVLGSVYGGESRAGSLAPSRAGSVRPASPAPSAAHSHRLNLDAPINDDGFGGSMASTNQDILAGGLFEDGSLFDDTPASMPPSERVPPSDYNDGEQFCGPPSPMGSSGGSRGASPAPLDSMPGSPTPSHRSTVSHTSTARSMRSEAPSVRSTRSEAQVQEEAPAEPETTTLIHNEEESFALAPVEASAMKGLTRTKRKRKLIVDEVKAISGEEMKGQLSDTGDIVTTLDLAPPTKRLMHWKETGGVERLFALPGRLLQSRHIHDDYSCNLVVRAGDLETFDMLGDQGRKEEELLLEQVPGAKEFQEPQVPPAKKDGRGRKRKVVEEAPVESAYSRRQAELAAAVEEDARLERERNASINRTPEPGTPAPEERREEAQETPYQQQDFFQQTPTHAGGPEAPQSFAGDQTPGHESFYGGGGATPAYSDYQGGADYTAETPVYPPAASPAPDTFPAPALATPRQEGEAWGGAGEQEEEGRGPGLPEAQTHDFTDQWVSQAATATATGAALPPPRTPAHETDWDDNRPPSADSGRMEEELEEEEEEEEEEETNEYLDEETVEQFEDRVLNKRAAQLHCRLRQRMVEEPVLQYSSITRRKDTRKVAAQKFYSLLVLQKFMAVELEQADVSYGEMEVRRGTQFELDTSKVKAT